MVEKSILEGWQDWLSAGAAGFQDWAESLAGIHLARHHTWRHAGIRRNRHTWVGCNPSACAMSRMPTAS